MDRSLQIGQGVSVDSSIVTWRFDTSSGPGGQHANRSNTRVEASLVIADTDLDDAIKERLEAKLGAEVRVSVDDTRSQTRNRDLALDRLEDKLAKALVRPKKRRPTKPSRSSQRRRVEAKKRRSQTKSHRRKPGRDD